MAIVWPCPLTIDAYADAGRAAEVPRPDCPSCAGLAVDLGGPAMTPPAGAARFAADAVGAAFAAACGLPGWAGLDAWRFASAVTGGTLIAANTISPWLVVGRRRFMPPIPLLPA